MFAQFVTEAQYGYVMFCAWSTCSIFLCITFRWCEEGSKSHKNLA